MRRRSERRWSLRLWLFRAAFVVVAALSFGVALLQVPTSVWWSGAVVLTAGMAVLGVYRFLAARPRSQVPPAPGPGELAIGGEVVARVDQRAEAAAAFGAIAGFLHHLACMGQDPAELAVTIASWPPRHGLAVVDVLAGAVSGSNEIGAAWLASQPSEERWWWAALERDIRHVALGSRRTVPDVVDEATLDALVGERADG